MKRKSLRGPKVQQDIEKSKDASIYKGDTQAEPFSNHFEEAKQIQIQSQNVQMNQDYNI